MMNSKKIPGFLFFFFSFFICLFSAGCQENGIDEVEEKEQVDKDGKILGVDYFLPDIDLSHWKVTLPIGKPTEVGPPAILSYATNETLRPFMYNDSTDGSIVFYAYPQASTANSSYSRTELREQMVPGSNNRNWTFKEGGRLRGVLSVPEVSTNSAGQLDRVMIMQIHGRLTNAQRDLIGEDDNNAPPVLKIYWVDGKIVVKTKVLKNPNATDTEILHTSAWGDDGGITFKEEVGTGKFSLEVIASEGRMEVTLNDEETLIYENEHLKRWGIFENYFKAGNYLMSTEEDAFARVKYFELEVGH